MQLGLEALGLSHSLLTRLLSPDWRCVIPDDEPDVQPVAASTGRKRRVAFVLPSAAESIPGIGLLRASNTSTSRSATADWLARLARWGFTLPCDQTAIVAILAHLHADQPGHYAPDTVRGMLWAISRFHLMLGLPDPTKHYLVKQARAGYAALYKVVKWGSVASTSRDGDDGGSWSDVKGSAFSDLSTRKEALDWRVVSALLRSTTPTLSDESDALMVVTGFFLGLRPSSLAALRLCDINFGDTITRITIPLEKTEHRRARAPRCLVYHGALSSSPWLSRLGSLVSQRRANGGKPLDPLFPARRGGFMSTVALKQIMHKAISRVLPSVASDQGLGQVSGSSLRPGGCSAARLLGYSIQQVCHLFNWSTQAMVDIYSRRESGTASPDATVAHEFRGLMGRPDHSLVTPTSASPLLSS